MLEVIHSPEDMFKLSRGIRKGGNSIGFVPTMGYLHQGHISLIDRARKENDIVVVSIFVNPLQFGKNEDLDRYPRDFERDYSLCKDAKVDYIFYPSYSDMYPEDFNTYVEVKELSEILCGAFRPGHFRGVTTVVLKLFNIVSPDRAYFGKKDYQQLQIIKRMVKDLNIPVEIVACPTVREPDGLAMSSRNRYLSPEERLSATYISKALFKIKDAFDRGASEVWRLKEVGLDVLNKAPLIGEIQYLEVVHPENLKSREYAQKGDVVAVAVFIGNTRLIDNIEL
ncbi:MAG: pantoate--beta-alanine ligase [Hydrogenothermaceae bacterium]|nr:pantoate--beta-alanine ligase [Hydrogenothermaceae bacterium]